MKKIINPFFISGYEGEAYFCDRMAETQRLGDEIANGNDIALIASRRMGKSGMHRKFLTRCLRKRPLAHLEIWTAYLK